MIPFPQRLQSPEPYPKRHFNPNRSRGRHQTPSQPIISSRRSPHPSNFRACEHACRGPSPPLPVQRAPDNFVDRPPRITQWYVLAARTARMLALPALPASLISLKTKRAVRASVSAPRTYRRYPVVHPSLMLAVSANRHDPSISILLVIEIHPSSGESLSNNSSSCELGAMSG
jgi:hypothetical protein